MTVNAPPGEDKAVLTVEVCLRPESGADLAAVRAAALAYCSSLPSVRYAEGPLAPPPGQHPLLDAHVASLAVVDLADRLPPGKLLLQWDVHWQVGARRGVVRGVGDRACAPPYAHPHAEPTHPSHTQPARPPHTHRPDPLLPAGRRGARGRRRGRRRRRARVPRVGPARRRVPRLLGGAGARPWLAGWARVWSAHAGALQRRAQAGQRDGGAARVPAACWLAHPLPFHLPPCTDSTAPCPLHLTPVL